MPLINSQLFKRAIKSKFYAYNLSFSSIAKHLKFKISTRKSKDLYSKNFENKTSRRNYIKSLFFIFKQKVNFNYWSYKMKKIIIQKQYTLSVFKNVQ